MKKEECLEKCKGKWLLQFSNSENHKCIFIENKTRIEQNESGNPVLTSNKISEINDCKFIINKLPYCYKDVILN